MGVYSRKRNDGTAAWFFDFMHQGIRYRGVGGTTRTQALRALEKRRAKVLSGEHELETPSNPKIDAFAEKFLERRQDHRSFNRDVILVRHILRRFRGRNLSSIRADDVEDYKFWRKAEGVANATVNREIACLKRIYNLAIQWRDARRNPVQGVKFLEEPKSADRFLSQEEAVRLIDGCQPYFKSIVVTALNTGMRVQEILNLKWNQVYVDQRYVEIVKTKNKEKRYVPLNDTMTATLWELSRDDEHVFLGKYGRPLRSVRKPWMHAKECAGIEKSFRFHDLRHTFISHMVMKGVDLLTIARIVGHKDVKMIVDRYGH
ncbi:MAG: tyrosine-type recombinase/integrase, partial [Nitrososphaera sp.]|nr:tyrosine-type recombinase/integrase [Nitrososphaera sp.]